VEQRNAHLIDLAFVLAKDYELMRSLRLNVSAVAL